MKGNLLVLVIVSALPVAPSIRLCLSLCLVVFQSSFQRYGRVPECKERFRRWQEPLWPRWSGHAAEGRGSSSMVGDYSQEEMKAVVEKPDFLWRWQWSVHRTGFSQLLLWLPEEDTSLLNNSLILTQQLIASPRWVTGIRCGSAGIRCNVASASVASNCNHTKE